MTTTKAYYNEIDPFCCEWLRALIKKGLITDGEVDNRDIRDVLPGDVKGFQRVHWFAGIAGWDHALNLVEWGDRPVWTGSCPCQSFSQAGKRKGFADERHLWPSFFHLIQHGKPRGVPVFGEQVASPDALAWLDLVQDDMEGEDHTVWATDICAAGVGAPIIRQRLWWVAFSTSGGYIRRRSGLEGDGREEARKQSERLCDASGLALPNGGNSLSKRQQRGGEQRFEQEDSRAGEWLAQPQGGGWREEYSHGRRVASVGTSDPSRNPGPPNSFWSHPDWILCRDGKWRPVESGTQPLSTGIPNRVGQLRGYGNSIVPWAAKEFIEAWIKAAP